ncbi:hypothetical protein [Oceaniglobus indicus]|uniref:hypothetical protein n=1 Tax=Oceaniglobus indicus TaxID=2047749 RepID=UPI0011AB6F28|nr:hypothetical protein [Oceaniglobus indicus]
MTTTAVAAILALPLATAPPALAQDTGTASPGNTMDQSPPETASDAAGETRADPLIVTVGETEITASDVTGAIGSLPQNLQQRPAEQLIPFVVDQLVFRALVLESIAADSDEANQTASEDMPSTEGSEPASDGAGTGGMSQTDKAQRMQADNAAVKSFMDERMEGVVTDEKVQAAYDAAAEKSEAELPPLKDVRLQIEQQLRQQELAALRRELEQTVDIVFYGPDGKPRDVSVKP